MLNYRYWSLGPTRSLITHRFTLCLSTCSLSLPQALGLLSLYSLWLHLVLLGPNALLLDLGLLNLTQSLPQKLLDYSGQKVSQIKEVFVPMIII